MTNNTLKITYQQKGRLVESTTEQLERIEAGESGELVTQDEQFILNFENLDDLALLMRTPNLELIQAIVAERPESIRQTADAVDRDYREVHRNLEELKELGVIEFERTGQRKRPILRDGAKHIDLSIQFPPHDDEDTQSISA
jgi:predicted transcriptional regulator